MLKPLFIILLIVIQSILLNGCANQTQNQDAQASLLTHEAVKNYEISANEVAKKLNNQENFILIDVRTPEEYEEKHLNNSILIPLQNLESDLMDSNNKFKKDDEIIVYCRSGHRSAEAYLIFKNLGFQNVKSMAGGIIEWQNLGNKICKGENKTC
jgi:rhodanese-related sulfurtransferase